MSLAIPLLLILGAAALLALLSCGYLLIYRAHVNRALSGGARRPMAAPHVVTVAAAILVLVIVAAGCWTLGAAWAYDRLEDGMSASPAVDFEPFTLERPALALNAVEGALETLGIEEDGLRISGLSLAFLDGEFSSLSFTAWTQEGGVTRESAIQVNVSGQLFEQWSEGEHGDLYAAAVPYDVFRGVLLALGGRDWDGAQGGAGFYFAGRAGLAKPGSGSAYLAEDGELTALTEAVEGDFYAFSFVSAAEYVMIYAEA